MANKNFKARIGIEAPLIASDGGTTAITLSGADVTVVGDLTVSGTTTTLDTQNLLVEDKNIIIGNVAVPSDLTADGGGITLKGATDKTFTWLDSNDSWNFNQNIVTTGNVVALGILDVQGGTITDTTGALSITTGALDGAITLDPNGTGDVVLTFANGGNLVNSRNYVLGAIRSATTKSNGDAWSFLNGTGTGYRGITIDNSTDTTKAPSNILRSFTGGAVAANGTTPTITFERARGTSASPTAIQSGDLLGRIVSTGANGANTFIGDAVAASPATLQFLAAETFSGTTNVGTQMTVALMPTAKTLAGVTTPTVVLGMTPQATTQRSDSFTWANGNTIAVPNQNTKLTLDSTGQLVAYGNITTLGTLTFNNELAVNAKSELLNTNTASGTTLAIQTNYRPSSGSATFSVPQAGWQLGNFRFNSNSDTAGAFVLGAQVTAGATENWTPTANGSQINFFANKVGQSWTTGLTAVISASPETTTFKNDLLTLKDSSGTNLVGNKIVYNRVYGQWQYDATITPAAANTAYAIPFQGVNAAIDFANIATTSNTSEIRPNALGMYKLQFSAQVQNADVGQDHQITFWWRKNGVDITNSAGYFTVPKAGAASGALIVGWDNIVEVTTITDYYQLMYAVSDTDVTLPFIAASAPRPGAASVFLTLVTIGA